MRYRPTHLYLVTYKFKGENIIRKRKSLGYNKLDVKTSHEKNIKDIIVLDVKRLKD